jgi:hypothetical protein
MRFIARLIWFNWESGASVDIWGLPGLVCVIGAVLNWWVLDRP